MPGPNASAHALQQLETGRAILIEGQMPPAVIRLVLWWEDHELRRRTALGFEA